MRKIGEILHSNLHVIYGLLFEFATFVYVKFKWKCKSSARVGDRIELLF